MREKGAAVIIFILVILLLCLGIISGSYTIKKHRPDLISFHAFSKVTAQPSKTPGKTLPQQVQDSSTFNYKTSKLSTIPNGFIWEKNPEHVVFSKGGNSVSYIVKIPNSAEVGDRFKSGSYKMAVVTDNITGKYYDYVSHLIVSQNGQDLLYGATVYSPNLQNTIVFNNQEVKWYTVIPADSRIVNVNGENTPLYTASVDSSYKDMVVIGDKAGKAYDKILFLFQHTLTPNGFPIYIANNGGKYFAVVGETENKSYDYIYEPEVFNLGNGFKFTYLAKLGEQQLLVINDEEIKVNGVDEYAVSPDGNRVAYIEKGGPYGIGTGDSIVVDGKPSQKYPLIQHPLFSPNSQSLAYIAGTNEQRYLFINGQPSKTSYRLIENILFSPDSKSIAYTTSNDVGGKINKVVLNGTEGKAYDINIWGLTFSSDSQNLAYIAADNNKNLVVINGQEGKSYDTVENLSFIPNINKVVYKATEDGKEMIVIGNREGNRYDAVFKISEDLVGGYLQPAVIISPDKKNIGYGAKKGNEFWWIVESVD